MPVRELVSALQTDVPETARAISDGLIYRNFLTVGLLLKQLAVRDEHPRADQLIRDTWLYIQEPEVFVGRMQIFNN